MILVNLARIGWSRPERTRRDLSRFFARVPVEGAGTRVDRRIFRWVLCGQHGFGRNWRDEECPQCGGYAERVANPPLAERLGARGVIAEEELIRAAARRAVADVESRFR